ncbi:hypothetical protein DFH09DRAFT_1080956 [Mycena vulgaris]|nr:hypothetical protein DFH09DRAFT_1080956 [Mycena vulgaris]
MRSKKAERTADTHEIPGTQAGEVFIQIIRAQVTLSIPHLNFEHRQIAHREARESAVQRFARRAIQKALVQHDLANAALAGDGCERVEGPGVLTREGDTHSQEGELGKQGEVHQGVCLKSGSDLLTVEDLPVPADRQHSEGREIKRAQEFNMLDPRSGVLPDTDKYRLFKCDGATSDVHVIERIRADDYSADVTDEVGGHTQGLVKHQPLAVPTRRAQRGTIEHCRNHNVPEKMRLSRSRPRTRHQSAGQQIGDRLGAEVDASSALSKRGGKWTKGGSKKAVQPSVLARFCCLEGPGTTPITSDFPRTISGHFRTTLQQRALRMDQDLAVALNVSLCTSGERGVLWTVLFSEFLRKKGGNLRPKKLRLKRVAVEVTGKTGAK